MKKTLFIITVLLGTISLLSCGADDGGVQAESQISINQSDNEVDVSYDFATESDAVEYYFNKIQAEQNSDTLQVQSNGQTGIYVYSLENIPQGFTLGKITSIGNKEYYNEVYRNSERKTPDITANNACYFTWFFEGATDKNFQNTKNFWEENGCEMTELSNKSGYYYIFFDTYSHFYWIEDEYLFFVKIPTSVGTVDPETHEYSGEDVFTLKKTFYPFDDNTVAE